jgi:hydrogenase/urease accessory protein HupE
MMRVGALLVLLLQVLAAAPAVGHEVRPAYLDMRERAPGEFAVLWKVPALGELRLGLYVRLPESCKATAEPIRVIEAGAFFERSTVACRSGLKGQQITIDGLRATATDVLVRIEHRSGATQVARLTPEAPALVVAELQSGLHVAVTYLLMGVDHIITGFDHLLFILGLMLLIRNRWMLVKTITAFTVAHSITLAGAVLGYLSLPQKPVEAAIALSIAFVASELVKTQSGPPRLSETYPWIVALGFGLLHGFGFAGALKETGLPQTDIPLALLAFNFGVEAGQLLFVAAVLSGFMAVRAYFTVPITQGRLAAAYLIGTTSMVWLFTRVSAFGI